MRPNGGRGRRGGRRDSPFGSMGQFRPDPNLAMMYATMMMYYRQASPWYNNQRYNYSAPSGAYGYNYPNAYYGSYESEQETPMSADASLEPKY